MSKTGRLAATAGTVATAFLAAALLAGCSVAGTPTTAAPTPTVTVVTTATTTDVTTSVETVPVTVTETAEVTVTASSPAAPVDPWVIPEGYFDDGGGLASSWADEAAYECSADQAWCWGVLLISDQGCPNGVVIRLEVYPDGGDTVLTQIEHKSSTPIPARGEPVLEVPGVAEGTLENGEATEAGIVGVACQ